MKKKFKTLLKRISIIFIDTKRFAVYKKFRKAKNKMKLLNRVHGKSVFVVSLKQTEFYKNCFDKFDAIIYIRSR